MSFSTHKVNDINELTHFLNGGVVGVDISRGVDGLVGTTLTFTTPAFACTFTPAAVTDRDPYHLLQTDIITQINVADAGHHLRVVSFKGRIGFVERTPTTGVVIAAAASDAKRLLGFSPAEAVTGRVIKQMFSPAAPRVETVFQVVDYTYVVLIWEGA